MRVDIVSLVRKWYDNDLLDILVDKLYRNIFVDRN